MECLWDGEGCLVYGGEVVSDQYDVYPLYDGGVCDRKHKQEAQEGDAPELGAGEDGWVSGAFY